jgi:large subunit ribosomal protein L18
VNTFAEKQGKRQSKFFSKHETMKDRNVIKRKGREKRRRRVRKRVSGTSERPRLTVFRSSKHIYAQLIDDVHGKSLVSTSSLSPELRQKRNELKGKCAVGKEVGSILAEKAKKEKITKVVFDRAGYLYHGRVKAVADGAREGGLEF